MQLCMPCVRIDNQVMATCLLEVEGDYLKKQIYEIQQVKTRSADYRKNYLGKNLSIIT